MSDTEYNHTQYKSSEEEEQAVREWTEYDAAQQQEVADFCKTMMHAPRKDIAAMYVTPLLSEGILTVTKEAVTIMSLVIPRDRLALFCMALHWIIAGVEGAQGPRGYTYNKTILVDGNDTRPGFKISSNIDSEGSILLDRKNASEIMEIVLYFVSLDGRFSL